MARGQRRGRRLARCAPETRILYPDRQGGHIGRRPPGGPAGRVADGHGAVLEVGKGVADGGVDRLGPGGQHGREAVAVRRRVMDDGRRRRLQPLADAAGEGEKERLPERPGARAARPVGRVPWISNEAKINSTTRRSVRMPNTVLKPMSLLHTDRHRFALAML